MKNRVRLLDMIVSLLALVGGLFIGYIDQHATEEVVTLGLLVALNLFNGALAPGGAWRWPLLSSIGVPLLAFWKESMTGIPNPHLPATVPSYALLVGIVFCAGAAGASTGVLLRRGAERASRPLSEQ